MEHDPRKGSIDFFKKIDLEQEKNNSVKIWAMILFTVYHVFSRIKLFHFFGGAAIIISSVFTADYFLHSDSRAILNKNQQEFNHSQQIKNSAIEQVQAKINADKQVILVKQKIESIEKITPHQMNLIKTYMTKMRDKEILKLNEVYWTYFFINNNDRSMNMKFVNKLVRDQINVVNNFYKSRIFEITSAYDFVKAGHVELISPTYDNADALDKLINWNTLTKTDSAPYSEATDSIVADSTKYLKSPEKLNKYLEENKAIIESNKMFK